MSGSNPDRPQFTDLLESIEAGDYDLVVAWEISRISREGESLQRFLNACEDAGTELIPTDDNIERVKPDGTGRFVADIVGAVYEQERRTMIRRIKAGMDRAADEGVWVGQTPKGFDRDEDGHLTPILNPDTDNGDAGYLHMQRAMERLADGDSFRSVANDTPNVTRQTIANTWKDDDARGWYLHGTTEDERLVAALDSIPTKSDD